MSPKARTATLSSTKTGRLKFILAVVSWIAALSSAFGQVPPPVPALPDAERRTAYSITGTTCSCNVNFAIFGDGVDYSNWVEVFLNGTRVNFNDATFGWTITSPTGSLATIARPVTDAVLTFNSVQTGAVQIVGARRPRRVSQYSENRGVPARNLNQDLTDIIATLREEWDRTNDITGRGIFGQPGDTFRPLPPAATRASTVVGFDALGNLTTYSPSSAVTSASNVTFLQNGASAVSITFDTLYRGKTFIPEMYATGAISAPVGTAAASVPDATSAIQATINALCAIPGGGIVQLGPGAYGINVANINCNNVYIRGSGANATTLVHKMSAPSSALFFSAGASVLSNTGVSDLTIGSNDTVINKIAINASDVSQFYVRNVSVAHYPLDGTLYRASGGNGTALVTSGREHGFVYNFQTYAEQPIHIQANPNSTISMDSWVFRDLVLVSNLPSQPGAYHLITIDTGVNIFNTKFDGAQNWVGGNDGLHWIDTTSSQASLGLTISGVKSEQSAATGASGYTINIQHNTGLSAFKFENSSGGDRAFVKLRKVASATIDNTYFDPVANTGTNTVGLDIDSTVAFTDIRNAVWTGVGGRATTASIAGQNIAQQSAFLTGRSTAIPHQGKFTTATPVETFGSIALINSTANQLLLGQGPGTAVSSLGSLGTTTTVLHGNAAGASSFGAVVNADLATMVTNTVKGNATSGTASPTDLAVGSCSTSASALNWTTNTGFGCNTAVNAAQLNGATFASPGAIGGTTPSTGQFTGIGLGIAPTTGIFLSAMSAPAVTSGNQGAIGTDAVNGLRLYGDGSTYDVEFENRGGAHVCGVLGGTTNLSCAGYVSTGAVVVASLPTCNAAAKGARHFVTDATVTFTAGIGAVVAGTGANNVPVVCDGTNWRIGANDNIPAYLARKFA